MLKLCEFSLPVNDLDSRVHVCTIVQSGDYEQRCVSIDCYAVRSITWMSKHLGEIADTIRIGYSLQSLTW